VVELSSTLDFDNAVRRQMLRVALGNSGRSVALLLLAVGYIAWLGWQAGDRLPAALTLLLGTVVACWRLWLVRRNESTSLLEEDEMAGIVRQLEGNGVMVGLMWVVATLFIYPTLKGTEATIYVVIICGSVASAAFFMSMAGRSFVFLTALQLGSLTLVSLWPGPVQSMPLAVLAVVFGITMWRATRDFRDIAQRAMRHSLEVDEANASLVRAKEAAEAANVAKSQFLATMSHEIRTPMNGVLGALDLLRQTEMDNRQRRLVKTAAASGESLMDILNDVLDHSKIEAGKLVLSLTPMSLHAVAASATGLFRANAENRGLAISHRIDPDVPDAVLGDAPRLKQVLLNLLGNGLKFTEMGGVTLHMSVRSVAAQRVSVCFEVADTGIGIPAEAQDAVFQPFHQVDSTRSRLRGGTGLGLAISQRIVQSMGGTITLNSGLGQGSVFSFTLDFALAANLPPASQDSDFGALVQEAPIHGVVLLVEDNIVNRMIGTEMLQSLGATVLEAEDGAMALTVLESQHVDLVLMDIQMPVMDGYAAAQHTRERELRLRLPRIPILALTANAFDEDAAQARAAGMDGHLAKPYSRVQLAELLRRWL
jgi:signal transduction histidine kinase/CheY-like chemotaxis protein